MTFVAIGGAEDKTGEKIILRRLLSESPQGKNARICVITTATSEPEKSRAKYDDAFSALGVLPDNLDILHISTRTQANDPSIAAAIRSADVVFFSGGDQLRITTVFGGTESLRVLKEGFESGKQIIAGTSAGAAAASSLMVYGGQPDKALQKGHVLLTAGLSFVEGVIFDTHFSESGRLSRLFNAVSTNPGILGIGLDEDTAVIVRPDKTLEVIGSRTVTIVDGTSIKTSNITDVSRDEEMTTDGFDVKTLYSGQKYDLKCRKIIC